MHPPDSQEPDGRSQIGKLLKPRTPREYRVSGLAGLLAGSALLVPGALLLRFAPFVFARGLRKVTGLVLAVPYFILMTGLYRLVTGQSSEDAKKGFLWSLLRITLGVLFLVVTLGGLLFFIVRAAHGD